MRTPRPLTAALVATAAAAATVVTLLVSRDEAVADACPRLDRAIWTGEVRRGPSDRLATPGARGVVVCVYGPGERRTREAATFDTFAEDPWRERSTGRRIADTITNVMSPPPPTQRFGGPICRNDTGARYVVVLRYRAHTEAVEVSRSGCRAVSNGTWSTRAPTPPLVGMLDDALA